MPSLHLPVPLLYAISLVFIAANCLMVPDSDSLGRNIDFLSSFSRRQNAFVGHWQARGCLPVGCIPRPRPRSYFLAGCGWRSSAEHCFSQEWGICRGRDEYLSISCSSSNFLTRPHQRSMFPQKQNSGAELSRFLSLFTLWKNSKHKL